MEGQNNINPDIPLTQYEVVGRLGGSEEMGKWAFDILYFRKHGRMFPSTTTGPRIRLRGSENVGSGSS
jgi:hypothetical protein